MGRKRTGTIYTELTSNGTGRSKKTRYVAEITINGTRHKFRTSKIENANIWVSKMLENSEK